MASRGLKIEVETFRSEDLKPLLQAAQAPCVSIYVPTSRRFPEKRQDPIRYRKLVDTAAALLRQGPNVPDAEGMIATLRALEQEPHWERSLDGFVVFLTPAFAAAYRVPASVPEIAVVADSFHVKPLLRLKHEAKRYFVLTLSQKAVQLYEGGPLGAAAVDVPGLPRSLTDALGGVVNERRSKTVHGGGVAYHGSGVGKEETKEDLLSYFRVIDKGLREFLRGESAPLLLASVKYYQPIYREANTYPHLASAMLEGSYEHMNGDKIHADAWPIVSAAASHGFEPWIERYRTSAVNGLATDRIESVAEAVIQGRVSCVLAAEGETVWGVLDRATGSVERRERQLDAEDDDLLDDLCEETLKRGGEAFVVPRASMPTASPIAAVFRF
jgi:release factor family 3